jgi:hypothetical protein
LLIIWKYALMEGRLHTLLLPMYDLFCHLLTHVEVISDLNHAQCGQKNLLQADILAQPI